MSKEVIVEGTNVTWKPSGGTYGMANLTSLSAATACIGARADLWSNGGYPREMALHFTWKFAVAPNAGTFVNLYLVWANALTGTGSGGYTEVATSIAGATLLAKSPQFTQLGFIACDAVTTTLYITLPIYPIARYVQPVVYNGTNQAFSTTAADHIITMIPRWGVYV